MMALSDVGRLNTGIVRRHRYISPMDQHRHQGFAADVDWHIRKMWILILLAFKRPGQEVCWGTIAAAVTNHVYLISAIREAEVSKTSNFFLQQTFLFIDINAILTNHIHTMMWAPVNHNSELDRSIERR